MVELDLFDRQLLEHGSVHLHTRGPRALAAFLAESATDLGGIARILRRLADYRRGKSAEVIALIGGDRFPPRALRVVPSDFGEDTP